MSSAYNHSNINLDNNLLVQLIVSKKYRLYRHLVLILLILFSFYDYRQSSFDSIYSYSKVFQWVFFLIILYFNMYILVPRLLFRNQYGKYSITILFLTIIMIFLFLGFKHWMQPNLPVRYGRGNDNILRLFFISFTLIGASSGLKLFQRWIVDVQRINELERITMLSELEQLKNQINPHFLFNMLNNANVLVHKDTDKASQVLMSLSDLLRYQLYDCTRPKVLLSSEIHFLTDLLNLEKIRRDNFHFTISKEGEINHVQVAPLLFVTFVENAVKHNNDATKSSFVQLFFKVENDTLHFKCINSKPHEKPNKTNGGLGLENVKRRLELLYPYKHTLLLEDTVETYAVTLKIDL